MDAAATAQYAAEQLQQVKTDLDRLQALFEELWVRLQNERAADLEPQTIEAH